MRTHVPGPADGRSGDVPGAPSFTTGSGRTIGSFKIAVVLGQPSAELADGTK